MFQSLTFDHPSPSPDVYHRPEIWRQSVADSKKILAAARKAIRAQKEGHQVVVVVSAMGRNTDRLVELARQITDEPPAREMDMLLSTGEQVSVALMAMAIHSLGHRAISLTGARSAS